MTIPLRTLRNTRCVDQDAFFLLIPDLLGTYFVSEYLSCHHASSADVLAPFLLIFPRNVLVTTKVLLSDNTFSVPILVHFPFSLGRLLVMCTWAWLPLVCICISDVLDFFFRLPVILLCIVTGLFSVVYFNHQDLFVNSAVAFLL